MNTAADVLSGDATWGVDLGDVRARLAGWPAASVQCVVTSGPYYGLRDYGTATWEGGSSSCDHRSPTMRAGRNEDRPMLAGSAASNAGQLLNAARAGVCGKCGARRVDTQIGLEATPEQFVASYVTVFREVRRVLKDDAVLWLNIGDSYANDRSSSGDPGPRLEGRANIKPPGKVWRGGDLKKKDLIGIPWMLAFALRADGWHLRADVIWSKPNPMPESIRDRPTKAHEYLFLLTKGPRYYFDAKAIAEKAVGGQGERAMTFQRETKEQLIPGQSATQHRLDRKPKISGGASFGKQRHATNGTGAQSRTYDRPEYLTRNRRSVWTVATQSYKGAHFAVMPPKLVAPCVLAGSRPGDIVADPFAGSGTTLRVAVELGRRAVGVELNPAYLELIAERMAGPAVLTKAKGKRPRREKPAPSLFAGLSE